MHILCATFLLITSLLSVILANENFLNHIFSFPVRESIFQIHDVLVDDSVLLELAKEETQLSLNPGSDQGRVKRTIRRGDTKKAFTRQRLLPTHRRQAGYDEVGTESVFDSPLSPLTNQNFSIPSRPTVIPNRQAYVRPPVVKPSNNRYLPNNTYSSVRTPDGNGAGKYYYPERRPLPLPKCFHNPTGYVCCNAALNDLMVDVYTTLEQRPRFNPCNNHLIAVHLQIAAQNAFNSSFETIVSNGDFAQKIHFRGDLVCKVELASRYMLAYATASDDYGSATRQRVRRDTEEGIVGYMDSWTSIHTSFI